MMANYIVNETLCFVSVQNDKLDRANIQSIVSDFYTLDELRSAKKLLLCECDIDGLADSINSEYRKDRKKPNVEQKVVKDLLDI